MAERIEIVPAIDIIDGKCVRLTKGEYETKKVYDCKPAEMARAYSNCGVKRIHLVDLDGAKTGTPSNLQTLEEVAANFEGEIEWGGGLKDMAAIDSALNAGATHCVIGSVAALHPEMFAQWLESFTGEKLILGADVRGVSIAVKGWLEQAPIDIVELIEKLLPSGLKSVICTDISRDGMLAGASVELYTMLQNRFKTICFTASGGIGSMNDIKELNRIGMPKVIVGKAIYENRISLKEIEQWSRNE